MHRPSSHLLLTVLVAIPLAASGCGGRDVDLAKALQVTEITTGWFDAGIVEGQKNKLVPSISFRLKNADEGRITSVQMIAKFSRVGETEEWGSPPYIRAVGPDGLQPGGATNPIVLRSDRGYTGEQPRAQMLRNKEFVDARVELYAKHRANTWIKLGEYKVDRQLLTE
ncbi:MAG: hypothetical protein EHM13_11190 [Acidobacteria bacterium]|nr:MAG: hypothetical protein EHM13_11190 [Acidobacteriota bacterium]